MMTLSLTCTGNIIKEYLNEYNISQKELCQRTGYSEKHISNVLSGKSRLTEEFAIKLEKIIPGISASYWLNYEMKYRAQIARNEEKYKLKNLDLSSISKKFHFKEVFNGLNMSIQDQAIEMLKLLQISAFSQFSSVYGDLKMDFMEDGGEKEAIAIWVNMCREEVEIQNCNVAEYNEQILRDNLYKFKILASNHDTDRSIQSCRKLCNKLGINLVLVEAITNSKVRGALTTYKNNPAIYLSGRFKTHDNIWFAFMHEIGHLLYHYKSEKIIISYEDESLGKEEEANEFARNFFIDNERYNNFIKLNCITEQSIREFANQEKVTPGIVVARLQHDKKLSYDQFNYLKK